MTFIFIHVAVLQLRAQRAKIRGKSHPEQQILKQLYSSEQLKCMQEVIRKISRHWADDERKLNETGPSSSSSSPLSSCGKSIGSFYDSGGCPQLIKWKLFVQEGCATAFRWSCWSCDKTSSCDDATGRRKRDTATWRQRMGFIQRFPTERRIGMECTGNEKEEEQEHQQQQRQKQRPHLYVVGVASDELQENNQF